MSSGHGHSHHDHNYSGHDHDHDHDHEAPLISGPADSLFSQVDMPNVIAMNAVDGPEAGQRVIKSWEERDVEIRWCESDADDSLIIKIPFISSVSLRSITLKAGPSGQTPAAMHLYRDTPGFDFSDAEFVTPTQVFEVVQAREGVEYQVKASKFASLTSVTLFFPRNCSEGEEDSTRIYYIGLRGKWNPLPNRPGVIIYESAARPTDHKMEAVSSSQAWKPGY